VTLSVLGIVNRPAPNAIHTKPLQVCAIEPFLYFGASITVPSGSAIGSRPKTLLLVPMCKCQLRATWLSL
jgi:hypothetical protein